MTDDRWEHVIRHIQDAVVEFELVDDKPIVRRVNRAFEDVFGYDRDQVVDRSLNDVIVPDWLVGEARELDERTGSGKVNYQRIRRQTADGMREFLYRGIPYDGDATRIDGFAVYTDLTPINRRERQLQVLNRILRHNLRNRATVITGHTSQLLAALDDESDEVTHTAGVIEEAAHDLEVLAGEASQIKRVLEADDTQAESVDCARIVEHLIEEYRREHSGADIASDLPDELEVAAGPQLSVAIENLIENAIEHNPAGSPTVQVRVETGTDDTWVELAVDDDGPPIPVVERTVITGDRPITETEHGQGLGLWLVHWTIEQFGGELLFEESDMGGNSVRLRLPRAG